MLHIYWNLQCISSHIYSGGCIYSGKENKLKQFQNLLDFIAVIPVTVCKEVLGLANTVTIMI